MNGYIYPNSEKKLRELKGNVVSKVLPKEKRNGFVRDIKTNNVYMIKYINVEKGYAEGLEFIKLKGNVVSKVLPKEKRNGFVRDIKTNNVYMIKYINVEKGYAEGLEFIKLNDDFTEIEKVVIAEKGKYNRETERWELEKAVVNNIKGRTSENHEKYVSEEYNEPPENFVTLSINNIKGRTSENHEKYVSEEYNEPPENFVTLSIDPRLLTTKELKKEIKDLRITGGDIREGMMELGKRYSFPFASFVISFLGLRGNDGAWKKIFFSFCKFCNIFSRAFSWKQICKRKFSSKYSFMYGFRLRLLHTSGIS